MTEGVNAPTRDHIRQARAERREIQKAERRRKLIGVPLVLLGMSLIGAGAYVYLTNDSDAPVTGTEVGGVSVERTSTTVAVETALVGDVPLDPSVGTAEDGEIDAGETIPIIGDVSGQDEGSSSSEMVDTANP